MNDSTSAVRAEQARNGNSLARASLHQSNSMAALARMHHMVRTVRAAAGRIDLTVLDPVTGYKPARTVGDHMVYRLDFVDGDGLRYAVHQRVLVGGDSSGEATVQLVLGAGTPSERLSEPFTDAAGRAAAITGFGPALAIELAHRRHIA